MALLTVEEASETAASNEAAVAAVREVLAGGPFREVDFQTLPDEQAMIRARLRRWADEGSADLVLTLGAVGAAPRHRTADATLEVVEREFPGVAERMRAAGAKTDPYASLWRIVAGSRRNTMIVNLPAQPEAARVALISVGKALVEAVRVISAHGVSFEDVRDNREANEGTAGAGKAR